MESENFRPGDHIRIRRRFYNHHGICIGNDKVVHYAPPPGKGVADGIGWQQVLGVDSTVNTIHETELKDFVADSDEPPRLISYDPDFSYPPLKVVARACSRLGENGYNLWGNNCEHLASWCKTVQATSDKKALWARMRDGALLGAGGSLQTRQWQAILASAGVGLLAGAVKYWLEDRELSTSYDEFAAYASTLYLALSERASPYPLGSAFFHSNQNYWFRLPKIPEHLPDQEILFVCNNSWLGRPGERDWFVTERSIICLSNKLHIHLHKVATIRSHAGKLVVDTVDNRHHVLTSSFVHAKSLARFINAAIAGIPVDAEALRITRRSRMRQLLVGWFEPAARLAPPTNNS
ncbi:MAG: lecithin retinol acyltransferase family protein [Gammaproteobacteria bacterium]|nr:lecithin retinol acyltransferase family protein [Gammaproteobacteria bacterium]